MLPISSQAITFGDIERTSILMASAFGILSIIYENITVDENGLVTIEGILPGKYYIEEIKAPEGYEKNEKLIEFNIEYGEEKLISITNNKINITTREVSEKKLPKTGF